MRVIGLVKSVEAVAVSMNEDYPGQRREYIRQKIVELAVEAGDHIVMAAIGGPLDPKDLDYLTGMVATKWVEKVQRSLSTQMLRRDFEERVKSVGESNGRESPSSDQ